jgi:hypothetical protein
MRTTTQSQPMAYVRAKPAPVPAREELQARIPGWGVDLDPAVRPQVPKERIVLDGGPRWEVPEQQPERIRRERSIEHGRLTPVFGTSVPLHGLSGRIRRRAYERYSEAQSAHWLLLLLGDRVDSAEAMLRSWRTLRPDNPVSETGIRAELTRGGWSSRAGRSRADLTHQVIDGVRLGGPWLLAGAALVAGARRVRRTVRRTVPDGRRIAKAVRPRS